MPLIDPRDEDAIAYEVMIRHLKSQDVFLRGELTAVRHELESAIELAEKWISAAPKEIGKLGTRMAINRWKRVLSSANGTRDENG